MKFTYDDAFDFMLKVEGGYVNNANDHGGPTNFGITQDTYNSYLSYKKQSWKSVKFITITEAKECYKVFFWDKIRGDELFPALALCLFDAAVHQGPGSAVKMLQRVVGVPADGVFGPATLTATVKFGMDKVIDKYLNARYDYLMFLADRPGQAVFRMGWVNRILKMRKKVAEITL